MTRAVKVLGMRNIITASIILVGVHSVAHADNPFFGSGHQNQISVNFGHGTDANWLLPFPGKRVHFSLYDFKYSQPNTFFRLPGRQNINIAYTHGWQNDERWQWKDYSVPMFYLSEDVALYWTSKWYFGTGMGIGMQLQENERVGTKLIFGFKVFAGRRLSENWTMEFFMQHFSNGSTARENYSYNFYGLGVGYSF